MTIKKISKVLTQTEDLLLMGSLVVIFFVLLLQVVSRYVFNRPITWTEELARFIQIWITYLGLNYALRNHAHIRISMLVERFSKKAQIIIEIVINLIIIFCIIAYLPQSVVFYIDQALVKSTVIRLPMNWVTLPLVAGFAITCMNLILHTVGQMRVLISGKDQEIT